MAALRAKLAHMTLSMRFCRIYWAAFTIAYVAWSSHFIRRLPPGGDRTFATVSTAVFFLLYLLPLTLFGARIHPAEDGVRVEWYGNAFIPYSEIRHCWSFFLFPWQLLILTTKRAFPLSILLVGDTLVGKRRSLTQDGELAAEVKSRMASLGRPRRPPP